MLYYIKHEIIGEYVQQIQDGVPIRYRIFSSRIFFVFEIFLIVSSDHFLPPFIPF